MILRKCPTDGLDDSTITAEKEYSVNKIELGKIFAWACIIMVLRVIYLLILLKIINSKHKILKKNPYSLYFGNISKDFTHKIWRKQV